MKNELIPLFPGRPPVIKKNGQVHYISMHDQEYLRKLREFRTQLVMAHPDKTGGSKAKFLLIKRKRDQYRLREHKFYYLLGLNPPDHQELTLPEGWFDVTKYPAGSPVRGRKRKQDAHQTKRHNRPVQEEPACPAA